MPFTLVYMGSSADRSAADVALPICAGETSVVGNGVAGTGTAWYPKFNGNIVQAFCNSETAAAVDIRFRKLSDPYYNHLFSTHLQSDPIRTQSINNCAYPVTTGDSIASEGTNAGAVLDILGLYLSTTNSPAVSPIPPAALPAGARIVEATSATTMVADTVTEGQLTWVDFTPERDRKYKILGMSAHGATLLSARLKYIEGPYESYRPGVIAADTSTGLEYMMFYGDFGEFIGQTPPNFEGVAVAGDTAQVFRFVIVPM